MKFILTQCDWTKMSIFLILTGKSELILETERRKDVKRAKIVKLTFCYAPKRCWKNRCHFQINNNLMKAKWGICELYVQQRSFLVKKPLITKKYHLYVNLTKKSAVASDEIIQFGFSQRCRFATIR